ncbi:MAG: malonyl-ACP O-methyltransferase BioC [Mariprofundaceae bacterium]|nr:malonyl-ACP O-methyltransferase BioC [Mariprofundaceae bacterium]
MVSHDLKTSHIHRPHVKRAFSGAAETYDHHAVLQREIGDRLIAHLDFTKIAPKRILDIGCGTGYVTRLLTQKFKKSHVTGLDLSESMVRHARKQHGIRLPWHGKRHHCIADGCALPFTDASFDLVTSNLAMQWVANPADMLAEMRRTLAPGGLMLFSTFGRRTLAELRQSMAELAANNENRKAGHVLPFPDVMSLGDVLNQLPIELPVIDSDLFTLTYPNVMALVRELKGLGASSSAISGRSGGLYGRRLLKELDATYGAKHRMEDGQIRATFEALYAQAWHKDSPYQPKGHIIPIELQ